MNQTMVSYILRFAWRLLVLAAAVSMAYLTAFSLLPYLDRRIPLFPALVIVYIFLAYIGIPALFRLWRIVFKPNHIPRYATTGDGWSSDPVNIILICQSRRQLIRIMKAAGWSIADRVTLRNAVKMGLAIVRGTPYPTAPFSSLYLFGRRQDIGFQVSSDSPPSPRHRHHVRFWELQRNPRDNTTRNHSEHFDFWHQLLNKFVRRKRTIWIGAATHDVAPFAIRWRTGQITHQIDELTEKERDFLISSLRDVGAVRYTKQIKAGDPLRFRGQTFGVNIVVDAEVSVLGLKAPS